LKEHQVAHGRTTRVGARIAVPKLLEHHSKRRAYPLHCQQTNMSEQQNRNRRTTKEQSAIQSAGAEEARKGTALDDRCKAVERWIGQDDDACCRGID
jgi:hypothetical protein